jgi:hypothetical protein
MLFKVMEVHVLPTIVECVMTIATFDLWMSKSKFDTFDLAIDFIDDDWVFCHVTIGMFETLDTTRPTLAKQMKFPLTTYQFINKVIAYVKNKSTNLNMLAFALTSVISCELL